MVEHQEYRKGFLISGLLIGIIFNLLFVFNYINLISGYNLVLGGLYFLIIFLIWKFWPLPSILSSFDELLHKVTWPTWEELQNSSVVIAIASLIIALIIFLMDFIMGTNPSDAFWRGLLGYFYEFIKNLRN